MVAGYHVLDKLPVGVGIEGIRLVLDSMVEDVFREAKGEIVETRAARQAICRKTSQMFQRRLAVSPGANRCVNTGADS